MILASHRALEQNWLFFMSDGESVQRYSICLRQLWNETWFHLSDANFSFSCNACVSRRQDENWRFSRGTFNSMTYPGHQAGVTADSSSWATESQSSQFCFECNFISWLRAKVFELLSLLNVQSAEQLRLPKNARQVYLVIRPQKTVEILPTGLSSWNSARSSTEWHCTVK